MSINKIWGEIYEPQDDDLSSLLKASKLSTISSHNPLEKIKKNFKAFTESQLKFWGGIPVNEYHFLFQVLPHKFYHGVEHQKSTVILSAVSPWAKAGAARSRRTP